MRIIFIKTQGRALQATSKLHKNKERRKILRTSRECYGRSTFKELKNQMIAGAISKVAKVNSIFKSRI